MCTHVCRGDGGFGRGKHGYSVPHGWVNRTVMRDGMISPTLTPCGADLLPEDLQVFILCMAGDCETRVVTTVYKIDFSNFGYGRMRRIPTIHVVVQRTAPWLSCKKWYILLRQPEHFCQWLQQRHGQNSPMDAFIRTVSKHPEKENCSDVEWTWFLQVRNVAPLVNNHPQQPICPCRSLNVYATTCRPNIGEMRA